MTEAFPKAQMVQGAGGVSLATYRAGPDPQTSDKPMLLFLHGWPDLAFGWRHQFRHFAALGYPCAAADMRGYGASDAPQGAEHYGVGLQVQDAEAVINAMGAAAVIGIGHDLGTMTLWNMPYMAPGRLAGLVGLSVAQLPHFPRDPLEIYKEGVGERYYVVQFQTEGVAEPIFEADTRRFFDLMMRAPQPRDKDDRRDGGGGFERSGLDLIGYIADPRSRPAGVAIMSEDELARYAAAYQTTGFTTPVHFYRNFTANWHAQKDFLVDGDLGRVTEPSLMITAGLDAACPAYLADRMQENFDRLTRHHIAQAGHWLPQECADEVNTTIETWLNDQGW